MIGWSLTSSRWRRDGLAAVILAALILPGAPVPAADVTESPAQSDGTEVPSDRQAPDRQAALMPERLQFRDLFDRDFTPSVRAQALAGREVTLIGFVAPSPIDDAPFLVMVGAPAQFCPYCAVPEDQDKLPYLLVYPVEGLERYGARLRIRVQGALEIGLAHDEALGLPNMMRIRGARVVRDAPPANPSRRQAQRPAQSPAQSNGLAPAFDPTEVDE